MPDPWPPALITKARHFLRRGFRYTEGPPEALVDTEHNDSVTRAELEAMDEARIAKRLARPAAIGIAIGFRGRPDHPEPPVLVVVAVSPAEMAPVIVAGRASLWTPRPTRTAETLAG